jgi:AcrR family transcriptional regulator
VSDQTIHERPRAAKSAARRRHLLDTARNLFVERGFHQTGMAQIAAASGIAVGQIYRDFANKEAIVAAICETDLAAWLEEENLQAALCTGDSAAIRAWIERVVTDEPSYDNRRLMCELLAEVGRNQRIADVNQRTEDRLRTSLSAALTALAPQATVQSRSTLMDFVLALSWGMVARMELSPGSDHAAARDYAATILQREVAALAD